ncbi:RICIN domain-containing protein [Kitasatospora cineracea]|uniref:RICIN domain-containing protein n=1 Tax=Kitasatospora cineracea TaxID=88074 RepID=UPI0037B30FD0
MGFGGAFGDVEGGYDGSFRFADANSGKVLDDPGSSPSSGQALDQWTDTRSPNQWWNLVPATTGYYRPANASSGLSLDAAGSSTADGAVAVQAPAADTPGQDWTLVPV